VRLPSLKRPSAASTVGWDANLLLLHRWVNRFRSSDSIGGVRGRSSFVETRPAEVIANIAICLIHQTNYLLDQQLKMLEKEFIGQGGLCECMTKARLNYHNQ
jgi:four helix bundle suffix protein